MGWQLIESQSLQASAASVTFSSIPQTYKALKLVVSARSDISTDNGIYCRFNGDSGSNYSRRQLYGSGAAAASTNTSAQTRELMGIADYSTDTANTFGSSVAEIPNYTSSTQKSWSVDGVNETNGTTSYQVLLACLWTGTAAITSILLLPVSGNFVFGSTFTLYGLA